MFLNISSCQCRSLTMPKHMHNININMNGSRIHVRMYAYIHVTYTVIYIYICKYTYIYSNTCYWNRAMTVNHIFILFLASFTAHVNIHFFRIFVASIQPLGKVLSMAFPQDSDQQVRSISVVAHRARMASETMNDAP